MSEIDWGHVLTRARVIVESYDTSVTLRQLFYRLVAAQVIPNREQAYKRLSAVTAAARRRGEFPDLIDRGRRIHRRPFFESAHATMQFAIRLHRRDRTGGQDVSLYLGVEKAGLVVQLETWFGELGIPVLALGGYSSQTYVDDVRRDGGAIERPAVLLYAGDFDPSGEDIDRDFVARTDCWKEVIRIALDHEQVRRYRLPVNPGKADDSRASGFIERHGELMQVELDALPPEELRRLYQEAIDRQWDMSAYRKVLRAEQKDLAALRRAQAVL